LVSAEGFVPGAGKQTWDPPALTLGYRTSALRDGALKGALVVSATVQLQRGDGEEAKRLMAKLTRERSETQPIKTKNCGSVFKNPPGDSAGRLVQAAGLKGAREGAAVISTLHGNFIVNEGGAKASDVLRLIERVMAEVKRRFGIQIEPEVEMVGRWTCSWRFFVEASPRNARSRCVPASRSPRRCAGAVTASPPATPPPQRGPSRRP